jgi:hypothetical protein
VWWLLGIVVVALAIGIPLFVRSRRRAAWGASLEACEQEVAWFARVLTRELAQTPTADAAAGVWSVESGRVLALSGRLNELEASAPDDRGRARASTLNDAVLRSQVRTESLVTMGADQGRVAGLQSVTDELEAALARRQTGTNSGGRH